MSGGRPTLLKPVRSIQCQFTPFTVIPRPSEESQAHLRNSPPTEETPRYSAIPMQSGDSHTSAVNLGLHETRPHPQPGPLTLLNIRLRPEALEGSSEGRPAHCQPVAPSPTHHAKRANALRAFALELRQLLASGYDPLAFSPWIPFSTTPGDIGSSRNLTPVAL